MYGNNNIRNGKRFKPRQLFHSESQKKKKIKIDVQYLFSFLIFILLVICNYSKKIVDISYF